MSIQSRERTIIAAATLVSSLAFYQYARAKGKSEVPFVMLGAFVGGVAAELIILQSFKNQKK